MIKENNLEQEGSKMSVENALMEMGYLQQQANILGANDSEIIELDKLKDIVRGGGDIEKSLIRARQILSDKQDYH